MALDPPTLVTFEQHLAGLAAALETAARAADSSWPGASVPTCPGWSMLDLLTHTGMVHRWALAALAGDRETMGQSARLEEEGRASDEPVAWFRDGGRRLHAALAEARPDLEALVFLKEAPPAREFWARRQCHETTVHALDAIAARDGRAPTAADAWFDSDLAADGVDELLVGFWQRGRGGPRSEDPYAVLVTATDIGRAWLLEVGPERCVTTRHTTREPLPRDADLAGGAVEVYLALWNRGGTVNDDRGLLDAWREQAAIAWS